jgi:hypothetical protein
MDEGSIEMIYIPTDELVADILTKPLTGWKFHYPLCKLYARTLKVTKMVISMRKRVERCAVGKGARHVIASQKKIYIVGYIKEKSKWEN